MSIDPVQELQEFRANALQDWDTALAELFPTDATKTTAWEQIDDIVTVLNKLASHQTELFHPDPTSSELTGVARSREPDCIELRLGALVLIVRPILLEFYETDLNEWSYFRLGVQPLAPVVVSGKKLHPCHSTFSSYQELIDANGRYYTLSEIEEEERETPPPKKARNVARLIAGTGSYGFFSRGSAFQFDIKDRHRIFCRTNADDFHKNVLAQVKKRSL